MRLDDGDDAALGAGLGGAQDGCDLDRVVAVVVIYGYALPFAGWLETALDATEGRERGLDVLIGEYPPRRRRRWPPTH